METDFPNPSSFPDRKEPTHAEEIISFPFIQLSLLWRWKPPEKKKAHILHSGFNVQWISEKLLSVKFTANGKLFHSFVISANTLVWTRPVAGTNSVQYSLDALSL